MNGLDKTMLDAAASVMEEAGASSIIIFIDALKDWDAWEGFKDKKGIILAIQKDDVERALEAWKKDVRAVVRLPQVRLTRLGVVKLSVVLSITEGYVKNTDKIVCLTGVPSAGALDTLMLINLSEETEIISSLGDARGLVRHIKPEVLEVVLNIALELASEGREGRSTGTTFVIGDYERVIELSRPLIMNPFKGYPEEARNIIDASMHETIKEFSLMDGAFIIRGDGIVESAGVHLDAALEDEGHLPGLGCRHMAAAGITDVTGAVAVTISGSTGIVRIFSGGKVILEVERPSREKGPGGR